MMHLWSSYTTIRAHFQLIAYQRRYNLKRPRVLGMPACPNSLRTQFQGNPGHPEVSIGGNEVGPHDSCINSMFIRVYLQG